MAADNTNQRRNVATAAVAAATQLVNALYELQQLSDQRANFVNPFVDADFTGTANAQLTAAIIGTLFDFVLPAFQTTYKDLGNQGRNEQILLQVRAG